MIRKTPKTPLLRLQKVAGERCAILHEDGKIDTIKPIPDDMIPFFNALIFCISKEKR